MCTILLAWRCFAETPVVIAANRDELIARPSAPPALLLDDPPIVGGRDLIAGGTWLAVTPDGRVCAVTNRHPAEGEPVAPDPSRSSRGDIPVRLLRDATDPGRRLLQMGGGAYNPVNVLWASADRAVVAHIDDAGAARLVELAPGPHVLTVGDVDDLRRPKVAVLSRGMDAAMTGCPDGETLAVRLRGVLSGHETPTGDPGDAPCIHGEVYGTVSSSTVVVGRSRVSFNHAPGRPCVTPFAEVPVPAGGSGSSPT